MPAAQEETPKNLDECIDRIEQARDLDPAGDTSPDAQDVRAQIEVLPREHVNHGDKPK